MVRTLAVSLLRAQVHSLVRELTSHKLCSMANFFFFLIQVPLAYYGEQSSQQERPARRLQVRVVVAWSKAVAVEVDRRDNSGPLWRWWW